MFKTIGRKKKCNKRILEGKEGTGGRTKAKKKKKEGEKSERRRPFFELIHVVETRF